MNDTKLTQIFCEVDDFITHFEKEVEQHQLELKPRGMRHRETRLSLSEIMTILIYFQQCFPTRTLSPSKCF